MSYNYMPRMVEIWRAPMTALLTSAVLTAALIGESPTELTDQGAQGGESDYPLIQAYEDVTPYMILSHGESQLAPLYTWTVALGEQDKMALMCVYSFEDWNH